jgi:group I intron endonuclease
LELVSHTRISFVKEYMIKFSELPCFQLLKTHKFDYFKNHPGETLCCIYICLCLDNFKVYVGSSIDMRARMNNHSTELAGNRHHCGPLQSSYNNRGESKYAWFAIEKHPSNTDRDFLFLREQVYMDLFECHVKTGKGYNVRKKAFGPSNFIQKPERGPLRLKDPQGNIHEFICSISQFCREHNLVRCEIQNVINRTAKHHRMWMLPETVIEERPMIHMKHLDGTTVSFDCIITFGEVHDIDDGNLRKILSGKYLFCKGWGLPESERPFWELVDREGNLYKVDSLIEFCRERNLNRASIGRVVTGERDYFLGWHLPGKPPQPEKSYLQGLVKSERYKNSQTK